jgi:hypothetical protein
MKLVIGVLYLKSYNIVIYIMECPVCLEVIDIITDRYVKLGCNCTALFHPKCINEWINKNEKCLYCQTDLSNSYTLLTVYNDNVSLDEIIRTRGIIDNERDIESLLEHPIVENNCNNIYCYSCYCYILCGIILLTPWIITKIV